MHLKYLHYLGNESNNSILQAYGIIPKDKQSPSAEDALRPKSCPNCNEPKKPDNKLCAKCRMVLTYGAYNETLEDQKQKEDKLAVVERQLYSAVTTPDVILKTSAHGRIRENHYGQESVQSEIIKEAAATYVY
jgi:hypothetical protein